MHIKQLFEDFKQSKLKNTVIIKELHLNTLMYLPVLLKTCSKESQQSQSYLFEQILSLTLHLVHLASRDIFMCLLTLNSRKFLIEILDECSLKIHVFKKNVLFTLFFLFSLFINIVLFFK